MKSELTTRRPRRGARALLALIAAGATVSAGMAPAQATDWGGDGDSAKCEQATTVVATPIYGSRGNLAGKKIAEVQLRWSPTCYGNWSRVVLDGNNYSDDVTVEQVVQSEGREARSVDTVHPGSTGVTAWTKYLHLANSQSPACAQAWLSSNFGTLNYHTNGARVCAQS